MNEETKEYGLLEHYLMSMLLSNKQSITNLCSQLNVSRQTFYNWINSIHPPSFDTVMEMSGILATTDDEVYSISRQIWICIYEDRISKIKEKEDENV